MPRFACRLVIGMVLAALGRGAVAADAATTGTAQQRYKSSAPAFDTFRMLLDRDIFDPNRRPPRRGEPRPQPVRTPDPRPEKMDLQGTAVRDNQYVAFISAPSGSSTRPAELGTTVSQWRITGIDSDAVELTRNGKKMEWLVGQSMERVPGGEWHPAGMNPVGVPDSDPDAEFFNAMGVTPPPAAPTAARTPTPEEEDAALLGTSAPASTPAASSAAPRAGALGNTAQRTGFGGQRTGVQGNRQGGGFGNRGGGGVGGGNNRRTRGNRGNN